MPNHEPEVLDARALKIAEQLEGMSRQEQIMMLGIMAGRVVAQLSQEARPLAYKIIGDAVATGVATAAK